MERIDENQLREALRRIRDLRLWAAMNRINPLAVRQALITAMEIDTDAALHRGVSLQDLAKFDAKVTAYCRDWIQKQRKAAYVA